ncbi:hypothetical protein H311_02986, partial [Anncaliia algerae PRA109]
LPNFYSSISTIIFSFYFILMFLKIQFYVLYNLFITLFMLCLLIFVISEIYDNFIFVHQNLIISNFLINGILLLQNNVFFNKEKFLQHFFHVHFLLHKVLLYILVLLLHTKQLLPILIKHTKK